MLKETIFLRHSFEFNNSSVLNNTKANSFLCCETQDKALYIGKQFIELWKDYYLINRSRPDPSELISRKVRYGV